MTRLSKQEVAPHIQACGFRRYAVLSLYWKSSALKRPDLILKPEKTGKNLYSNILDAHSCTDGDDFCLSSQVSSKSSGLSSGYFRITELFHITLTQHTVRKTAHALEYAALCFLFSCSCDRCFKIAAHTFVLSAALYASSDELQYFCVRQSVPAERRTCGLSRCVIRTLAFL